MSMVFIDGFDHYNTSQIGYKWDTITGTVAVGSSYGRYGSQGLRIGDNASVSKVFLPANQFVVGFAFRVGYTMDTDQRIVCMFRLAGAPQCELRLTNTNQLQVTRNAATITGGLSSAVFAPGVTYFCEFKCKFSTSTATNDVIVRVGGVAVITLPAGSNVVDAGGTTANALQLGHGARGLFSTNYQIDFDDLYLLDGLGTRNNGLIGDQRVEVLWPTTAGTNTDFAFTGAASAVAAVNEHVADGDTSYISSMVAGNKSTFAFSDLATTPDTVAGLQLVFLARKDDAGTRVGAGVVRIGSTDYDGTSFGIADSYALGRSVFELNPATSAAWTPTEVNALEAGIKLVV